MVKKTFPLVATLMTCLLVVRLRLKPKMGPPGFSGEDQWTSTLSPDRLSTLPMKGLDGTLERSTELGKLQTIHFEPYTGTKEITFKCRVHLHPNGSV